MKMDNGGDLHNFAMQYAAEHDIRMRQAYAELLERGREAVESDETESVEETLDEEESPLDSNEEAFAQEIAEELPNEESIDGYFEDFHKTVQERAQADSGVADNFSPVLVRWYITHYCY